MNLDDLGQHITRALPDAGIAATITRGELTLDCARWQIARVLHFLRDDQECAFTILIDICGVDWPQREKRFDVVYHLLSITRNQRVRVKVKANEETQIPGRRRMPAANWFEREAYDMLMVSVPPITPICAVTLLTDYGFSGFPLRKDFPLTGFVEVRYDEELKRVVYQPVQLVQEFRDFDFMSPWEGAPYIIPGDEKATPPKVSK